MTQTEHNTAILNELQEIKRYTLLSAKRVLNIEEASIITGLSKSRIYSLTSANKIPFYKSPEGRALYFERDELENWLLARRFETTEEIEQKAASHVVKKKIGFTTNNQAV